MLPHNDVVLYIDESIYSRKLIDALISQGAKVKSVGTDVAFGSSDEVWLKACGEQGWCALTRDQRIRYRHLEKEALKEFSVGAFTFTGGQATGEQIVQVVLGMLPQILNKASSTAKPFLFSFTMSSHLRQIPL